MKGYRGADSAAWRYLELQDSLGNAHAIRYSRVEGMRWADSCATCGGTTHAAVHSKKLKRYVERCGRCGARWLEVLAEVPKDHGDRYSDDVVAERFAELGTLARLLDQIEPRSRAVYLSYLAHDHTESGFESAFRVAVHAGLLSPDHREPEKWVAARVRACRDALLTLLTMRGLLVEGAS
jgi:hypothetical protein